MVLVNGITQFYLPPTRPSWLYFVSIHQMEPPERGRTHPIQLTTVLNLSTWEGWKAELA